MSQANAIHTIGYGQRSVDEFIALLSQYEIEYLIDVRTSPHSRWKPEFNQGKLKHTLEAADITYVFMGDALGGKVTDPSCQRNGKVDFQLVREKHWFQQGVDRLETALKQNHRVAIMCAEQKPEMCHRTHLVAAELSARNVPVIHIDEHGQPCTHNEVMRRMDGGQLSLL